MKISNSANSYNGFCCNRVKTPSFSKINWVKSIWRERNKTLPNEVNASYDIKIQQQEDDILFQEFLTKKGKVTKEEYRDIVKNHPSLIIKSQKFLEGQKNARKYRVDTTPKTMAKIAYLLKQDIDKMYHNYKIVSVGTSPAMICEVMKFLGADVEYLPISSLGKYGEHETYGEKEREKFPNIQKAFDYLSSKGINENDNSKNIILLDFSATGKTINNSKKLLSELNNIPDKKIKACSLLKMIGDLLIKNYFEKRNINTEDFEKIAYDIGTQRISAISNVPHFEICYSSIRPDFPKTYVEVLNKPNEQIFKEFDEYSTPLARAYSLCAFNEASKINQ